MKVRLLRSLAISALTVLALLGLTASASQAASFKVSSVPTTITGESVEGIKTEVNSSIENEWFTLGQTTFYCKSHYAATLSMASSTTLETEVTLTRCQVGIAMATVQMNGCKFLYHLTSGSGDQYSGSLDLVCPAGKAISISFFALGCDFALPSQQGLSPVHFFNNTGAGDISVQATPSKPVHYTLTKSNPIFCPAGESPTKTGSYQQVTPVTLDSLGPQTISIG